MTFYKRSIIFVLILCFLLTAFCAFASDVKFVERRWSLAGILNIFDKNEEGVLMTSSEQTDSGFMYQDMINHWGEYAATELASRNIFRGMKIGEKYYFCPDTILTRSDFLVLLLSALKIDVESAKSIKNPFADADKIPSWANLYAKAAYKAGIVNGDLDNGKLYFRPNDTLTRIEMIKMLDKTIKPDGVSDNVSLYTDMYLVPDWGKDSVANMTDYGILKGYDDNTVRPYIKINRAMAAEFILQIVNYNEKNPAMTMQISRKLEEINK